jgi:hypothetical protein
MEKMKELFLFFFLATYTKVRVTKAGNYNVSFSLAGAGVYSCGYETTLGTVHLFYISSPLVSRHRRRHDTRNDISAPSSFAGVSVGASSLLDQLAPSV